MKPSYDLYLVSDDLIQELEAYDPDYEAEQANDNYEDESYEIN